MGVKGAGKCGSKYGIVRCDGFGTPGSAEEGSGASECTSEGTADGSAWGCVEVELLLLRNNEDPPPCRDRDLDELEDDESSTSTGASGMD